MTDILAQPSNATPLTDQERLGLRLPLLTRAALNRAEAENISQAMLWLFGGRRRLQPETVLTEAWLVSLHLRMYGQVWMWAGKYRTADRNIGIPYWQVRGEMRVLEGNARAWLADGSEGRFSDDECAIRFGYRLVVIHPFPNGNGRWSRLASDALVVALGGRRFSWGGDSLTEVSQLRREYIRALQTADHAGDFGPLLAFARG